MYKEKITALVITYNEIGYIEDCIASVSFADEIIVVDSYSNDGTYEYLSQHPGVKVIRKPFENFTLQKSYALSQASNDWILFLDADEVVTAPLEREIRRSIQAKNPCDAYWCYKKFMFRKRPLHFCAWRSDKNYRVFRKSKVRFSQEKLVHETLVVRGATGIFKEKLIHYSYKNYADYKSKMLHYGKLKAKETFSKNKKFNYLLLIMKPLWKFAYNYIIRLGMLDARNGLIISYLGARGEIERYMELRRLSQQEKEVNACRPQPVESYN